MHDRLAVTGIDHERNADDLAVPGGEIEAPHRGT